jgi:hypothetical protein
MMLAFKDKQMLLPHRRTPPKLLPMLPLRKLQLMLPFPTPHSQLLASFWWGLETQLMHLWIWVQWVKCYL